MDILEEIVADKRKRLIEHKAVISEEEMKRSALESRRKPVSFYNALAKEGLSIIGEFKKASPSMGVIDGRIELTDRIDQYNESVDAISVLTEEDHFNGGAWYLKRIREISPLPIIRKDFIIDEYQIYEARVIGADCILLIAAILNDTDMKRFYELAYSLSMDVLLEVHNEEEMERALNLNARIIGVNNRNLKDFTIDLKHTLRLSKYMDRLIEEETVKADNVSYAHTEARSERKRPLLVSESGVAEDKDIIFLKESHVDALLIGRAFMESERPKEKAVAWKKVYNTEPAG